MAWPSKKLRWRVFPIAFLLLTVALVAYVRRPAEMKETAQDRLSPRYGLVMFPVGEVPLFQSTRLDPANVVGTLERGVGVSHAEFVNGVVAVHVPPGRMAYARVTELALLPASDDPELLERWRAAACPERSTCEWSARRLDGGVSEVRLSIADHEHGRRDRSRYRTDGKRLTRVWVAERRTVFDLVRAVGVYVGLCLITLIGCVVVFRGPTTRGG